MCGICGSVDLSGPPQSEDRLRRMTETLRHRGPDDIGVHLSGPAGLGHTRLSIIDLSSKGHQPMLSEDEQVAIVFNGEIYNFMEIRQRLEREGARFRSRSDTEVILRAYQRWGADSFALLEGMFAIAIWDAARKQLHAARDRFGIKPFYYHLSSSELVFGSEVKAILASGKVGRRTNLDALHEYLYYGTALGSRSLFEGIARLQPGHHLVFGPMGLAIHPFASIHDIPPVTDDPQTATDEIRRRLEEAVKSHLVSDVPVGVFLSGGIDSSASEVFGIGQIRLD